MRTAQDFAAAERDEPVRWLYALAQAKETDLDALMVIANQLPHQTMALCELAVDLARTIEADILRYSEAAGTAARQRAACASGRARRNGEAVEEDSAIEALKARIGAILDAAEKTGALDENALAELPSGLAEQLRAAWAAARPGSGTESLAVDKLLYSPMMRLWASVARGGKLDAVCSGGPMP